MSPLPEKGIFLKTVIRLLFIALATFATGCVSAPPPPPEAAFRHRVRYPDETVPLVSQWYTGTAANARVIASLSNLRTEQLQVGDNVWIPRKLLIRHTQISKRFLEVAYQSPKELTPQLKLAAAQREDVARQSFSYPQSIPLTQGGLFEHPRTLSAETFSATAFANALASVPVAPSTSKVEFASPKPQLPSAAWVRAEMERDEMERDLLKEVSR